jgi:hypothetical protein
MIRHLQPQLQPKPQPQTTFCATLSSAQLQCCQKEGFIQIERDEKANRDKEKERVEHVQGTGIPNLYDKCYLVYIYLYLSEKKKKTQHEIGKDGGNSYCLWWLK